MIAYGTRDGTLKLLNVELTPTSPELLSIRTQCHRTCIINKYGAFLSCYLHTYINMESGGIARYMRGLLEEYKTLRGNRC